MLNNDEYKYRNYFDNLKRIDSVIKKVLSDPKNDNFLKLLNFKNNKKTLTIVIFEYSVLNKLIDYFPFPFFSIDDVIDSKNATYDIDSITSDYILLVTDNYDNCKSFSKCSHSKILYPSLKVDACHGEIVSIDFAGINAGSKDAYVLIPPNSVGIMWLLQSATYYRNIFEKNQFYIDLMNFQNDLIHPDLLGSYNPWDFLFKQYCCLDCSALYSDCKINFIRMINGGTTVNWDIISSRVQKQINHYQKIIGANTLGVLLRGTDYNYVPYHQHPLDANECCFLIDKYLHHYHLDKIFLSTEDLNVYNLIKYKYGSKLIAIERERYDGSKYYRQSIGYFDNLLMSECYLLESILLTKTIGIIASNCGASKSIKNIPGPLFFDTILSKYYNSANGSDPIHVISYNKNYFNPHSLSGNLSFSIDAGTVNLLESGKYTLSCSISLKKYTYYTCSWICSKDLDLSIKIIDSADKTVNLSNGSKFILDSIQGTLSVIICINSNKKGNSFCLQIEKGVVASDIEPYCQSETIIPLEDCNQIFYKSQLVNLIDLNEGFFIISDKKMLMNSNSLTILNNLVQYDGGHTEYIIGNKRYSLPLIDNGSAEVNLKDCIDTQWIVKELSKGHLDASSICLGLIKHNLFDDALFMCNLYPKGYYALGIAYEKGINCEKNEPLALQYFKRAIASGHERSLSEYIRLVYAHHDLDSLEKLEKMASDVNIRNRYELFRIIGVSYRTGIVKPIDLSLSINWLKKAISCSGSPRWYYYELVTTLYLCNTEKADQKILEIIKPLAEIEDPTSFGWLGRMYYNGRGLNKDVDLGLKYLKYAADHDVSWAKIEFMDCCISVGSESSLSMMIEFATDSKNRNNMEIIGRLARAYRDGKGVSKNIDKSLELYAQASKTLSWAKREYLELQQNGD